MKKVLLFSIVLASITVLVIVGAVFFWNGIQSKKYAIAVINTEIQNRYKNDTAVSKLRKIVSNAQDDQQLLAVHFLRKSQTVDFLNSLDDLGTTASVVGTIDQVVVAKDGKSLSISVTTKGTLQNVYTYMYLIENLPYLISIQSLTLTVDPGQSVLVSGGKPVWIGSFTFSVNSYSDVD